VQVSIAAHTPQVDVLKDGLAAALEGIDADAGVVPFYSTVSGALLAGEQCGRAYWIDNLREPVQFWNSIQAMAGDGYRTFVELSPHPVLSPSIQDGLRELRVDGQVLASMRRGEDDRRALLETLGSLYCQGHTVEWKALYPDGGRHAALPTYPFQRKRFWLEPRKAASRSVRTGSATLLGEQVGLSFQTPMQVWQSELSLAALPFLADHRVQADAIFPAAGYLEMALDAGARISAASEVRLEDLSFERMLALPEDGPVPVQFVYDGTSSEFRILRRTEEGGWDLHATGRMGDKPQAAFLDLEALRSQCPSAVDAEEFYDHLAESGLHYGPAFRGAEEIWRGDGEAIARLRPLANLAAILDSCFHVLAAALATSGDGGTYVPVAITALDFLGKPQGELWAHARISSGSSPHGDISLMNGQGETFVRVTGLQTRRIANRTPDAELNQLLYSTGWQPSEAFGAEEETKGTWLLLGDDEGRRQALGAELEAQGQTCIQELAPCTGIVYFCTETDAAEMTLPLLKAAQARGSERVLELVQTLAQAGWRNAPRLYFVTRGTQPVGAAESPALEQAPLWGFARTVALEHSEFRCVLIDLDPVPGDGETQALRRICLSGSNEQEIALRGGRAYVARVGRAALPAFEAPAFREDGTYLITGAFGGIGLTVAGWLIEQGARNLALLGIREPSAAAGPVIEELRGRGARVITVQANVADGDALADAFQTIDNQMPPLRGIFHCAGRLDDGILLKLTAERLRHVAEPKMDGGWNLHVLTRQRELDYFVLFSSAASMLGSPGQANYTAANAFLDSLAHYRRSLSLPGLSINWGPWAEVGLAAAQENRGRRLAAQGIGSLTPEQGVRALGALLTQPDAQLAVIPFSLRQWREFFPAAAGAMRLAGLMEETGAANRTAEKVVIETVDALHLHIQTQIARVLRLEPEEVELETPFGRLGLDSLMGLEIRNRLEGSLGLTLPASLVWTYPTVAALAAYLADTLGLNAGPAAGSPAPAAAETELEELSDEESERLLEQELAAFEKRRNGKV
jgi:myxalamid-type polyketide synthase MxaE and MxaD